MPANRKLLAFGLVVIGMLTATVGAETTAPQGPALWLALGGSALAWGTIAYFRDVSLGRWGTDERFARICRRAGHVAMWAVVAGQTTLLLTLEYLPWRPSLKWVLVGSVFLAVLVYVGATAWFEEAM